MADLMGLPEASPFCTRQRPRRAGALLAGGFMALMRPPRLLRGTHLLALLVAAPLVTVHAEQPGRADQSAGSRAGSQATATSGRSAEARAGNERRPSFALSDVIPLLTERKDPLYFTMRDLLVRVEYAKTAEQLYVYALTAHNHKYRLQELAPQDPLAQKIRGNFDADLIIVSCGREFGGADQCDQYSPIKSEPRSGLEIKPADVEDLARYVDAIGNLLKPKPTSR
jgi:hypothetical protein